MKKMLTMFNVILPICSTVSTTLSCSIFTEPKEEYTYYDQDWNDKKIDKEQSEALWNSYSEVATWPFDLTKKDYPDGSTFYKQFNLHNYQDFGEVIITNEVALDEDTIKNFNTILPAQEGQYLILNFPKLDRENLTDYVIIECQIMFVTKTSGGHYQNNDFDNNFYWIDVVYQAKQNKKLDLLFNWDYFNWDSANPFVKRGIVLN